MAQQDDNGKVFIYLAIGATIFFAGKSILSAFGLGGDDNGATADLQNRPVSENPFAYNFGTLYNAANEQSADIASKVNTAYAQADAGIIKDRPGLFTIDGDLFGAIDTIYSSYGQLENDYNTINAGFGDLTSQFSVSLAARLIKDVHNKDLWTLINNGNSFIPVSPSAASVNAIVTHVNALPVFPAGW